MSDVILDDAAIVLQTTDVHLMDTGRNPGSNGANRRALVHDFGDGITMNWNRDYPGGVTIHDLKVTYRDPRTRTVSGGRPPDETLNVAEELASLRSRLGSLENELAALKARIP